jgi:hypothetical protein
MMAFGTGQHLPFVFGDVGVCDGQYHVENKCVKRIVFVKGRFPIDKLRDGENEGGKKERIAEMVMSKIASN